MRLKPQLLFLTRTSHFELRTSSPVGAGRQPFDRLRACLLCSRHAAAIGVHGAGCRVRLGGLELEDAGWQEREGRLAIFSGDAWIGSAQVLLSCKKISPDGALTRVEERSVARNCLGGGWGGWGVGARRGERSEGGGAWRVERSEGGGRRSVGIGGRRRDRRSRRGLGEAAYNGAQVCHEGWSQGANGADGAAPFDGLRACCPPGVRGADEETRSAFLYDFELRSSPLRQAQGARRGLGEAAYNGDP
jgi:hypothetical protein